MKEKSPKRYWRGAHRCASLNETYTKVAKYLPVFGITRVANVTGLDRIGIPVYTVVRPNSRSLAVSQGKGSEELAAKISGIMEAVETWHAERFFAPGTLQSWEDLALCRNTVDLNLVSRAKQKSLTPSTRIYWNEGIDLMNDTSIWVPHELVHTDYTLPVPAEHGYFIPDTNGLASGNSFSEAVNHGICEVVERDALALWHVETKEAKKERRVDLNSIDDTHCASLVSQVLDARVELGVWDITTDVGVASFICKIASDPAKENVRPAYGSGTHPDRTVALSRALTEAVQSRVGFISGTRDDQYFGEYKRAFSQVSNWLAEINENEGKRSFASSPNYCSDCVEEDLLWLLEKISATKGVGQVAVVDLTRQEFQIPVVKVIIPGLESITSPRSRRYGPRMKEFFQSREATGCHLQ